MNLPDVLIDIICEYLGPHVLLRHNVYRKRAILSAKDISLPSNSMFLNLMINRASHLIDGVLTHEKYITKMMFNGRDIVIFGYPSIMQKTRNSKYIDIKSYMFLDTVISKKVLIRTLSKYRDTFS